jgi:hypothetical protein
MRSGNHATSAKIGCSDFRISYTSFEAVADGFQLNVCIASRIQIFACLRVNRLLCFSSAIRRIFNNSELKIFRCESRSVASCLAVVFMTSSGLSRDVKILNGFLSVSHWSNWSEACGMHRDTGR